MTSGLSRFNETQVMGHQFSGLQLKLLRRKLGPGELGSFRLVQVVRSCRRVGVKEDLANRARVEGAYVPVNRVRGASFWKTRSGNLSLLRHGSCGTGQYRQEEMTLINKTREAQVRVTSFSDTVLMSLVR